MQFKAAVELVIALKSLMFLYMLNNVDYHESLNL